MASMRPGTKHAVSLLACSDGAMWQHELGRYDMAVKHVADQKKTNELVPLDKWLWTEYPLAVRSRDTPHISANELSKIMKWKLLRGKFRPALQALVEQNSDCNVIDISTAAIAVLDSGSWQDALKKMTELRGVGPATASALLAPLAPSVPFMADEVLEATTSKPRTYTQRAYNEMRDILEKNIQQINFGKFGMTMEEMGKALWTRAVLGPDAFPAAPCVAKLDTPQEKQKIHKRKGCGDSDVSVRHNIKKSRQ